MPDAVFSHPRVARVYDPLDPARSDLDTYVDLVHEVGAEAVLDVGCGTGTLACRMAADGVDVLGVDPAEASVMVARGKPGAQRVEWVVGTVVEVAADPGRRGKYDLATMTANVARSSSRTPIGSPPCEGSTPVSAPGDTWRSSPGTRRIGLGRDGPRRAPARW